MSQVIAGKTSFARFSVSDGVSAAAVPADLIAIVEHAATVKGEGDAAVGVGEVIPSAAGVVVAGVVDVRFDVPEDAAGKSLFVDLVLSVSGMPARQTRSFTVAEAGGNTGNQSLAGIESCLGQIKAAMGGSFAVSDGNTPQACLSELQLIRGDDYTDARARSFAFASATAPADSDVATMTWRDPYCDEVIGSVTTSDFADLGDGTYCAKFSLVNFAADNRPGQWPFDVEIIIDGADTRTIANGILDLIADQTR